MALEKELTGLDLPAELDYAAHASQIAPPPPDTFRSPTRLLKPCLDSVVMLELDDTDAAVSRAVGRRMDPTTGAIYHMDLSPPPGDVPGLLERLQPVRSISNDTEQLQKRLQVISPAPLVCFSSLNSLKTRAQAYSCERAWLVLVASGMRWHSECVFVKMS
jgi:hypothetical protein